MYKENLAINNLQWLTCHKNQANQSYYVSDLAFHEQTSYMNKLGELV